MPIDLTTTNKNTIASALKGEIGKRYKFSPWPIAMPDDKTLDMLAGWGKEAAIRAAAFAGIGYSMHRTGSVEGMTQAYLRMEYCRLVLESRGTAVPSWEVRARMATVVAIILFIWGDWSDQSPQAATLVAGDYIANPANYQMAPGVFPFSAPDLKSAIPIGKGLAK
jgi:hypothetical protein